MVLETREERALLLKAGFTGKQVEALYVVLNGFRIVTQNKYKQTE